MNDILGNKESYEEKEKSLYGAKNGINCLNCVKREFCQEICPEVEALLPKPRSGGHKKEINTDPFKIESLQSRGVLVQGKVVRGRGKGEFGAIIVSCGGRKTAKKGLYSENTLIFRGL